MIDKHSKLRKCDWSEVEAEYLAGIDSIRKIASRHGIAEASIRRKAKEGGWVRNPKGEKARAVANSLATNGRKISGAAQSIIDEAVSQDVEDMNLGLASARLALRKIQDRINLEPDDRGLKLLSETIRINIDTIRKIRGLDEKPDTDDDFSRYSEEELIEEIERLRQD